MRSHEAMPYVRAMSIDPTLQVECPNCHGPFTLGEGVAAPALSKEQEPITVFFCKEGCWLAYIPTNCCPRG